MRRIAVTVLLFSLPLVAVGTAEAQTCKAPPTSGPASTWAQGTKVTVYVDPSIPGWNSQELRDVVKGAFDAWDHVGGSDVSFTVVADADRAHNPPANSIGLIQGNRNHAHLRPGAFNLGSAVIEIDDYSANPGSLRSPLAHEIGHTFGLDNCLTCQPGQSIMGPGGLASPTACDRRAVRENGGYFGIDVGDGRKRPDDCQDCGVQSCTVTVLCRCPNRDCGIKEGRLVGDWQCTEMGRTCRGGQGCCRSGATGVGALAEPVCDGWERASECEWGSLCCLDPAQTSALEPPTCEAMGWYDDWQRDSCETVSGTTCVPVVLLGFSDYEAEPLTRECWQPVVDSVGSRSCGAMGGDYCSESGFCPPGYGTVSGSSDCHPCCKAGPSCGEMGGDYCSQSGSCPSGYVTVGTSWDCSPCCGDAPTPQPTPTSSGPSCGELGGTYCSQNGSCPGGFSSLGESRDCNPCCRETPPTPAPTPTATPSLPSCGAMGGSYCSQSGSCPGGYGSLGSSYDCNPCCRETPPTPTPTPTATPSVPSCGAMGGDYCGQGGSCPGTHDSLGRSYDCSPCCVSKPSCGAMGGDYCAQGGSCPEGFDSLGRSVDCNPCCVSR